MAVSGRRIQAPHPHEATKASGRERLEPGGPLTGNSTAGCVTSATPASQLQAPAKAAPAAYRRRGHSGGFTDLSLRLPFGRINTDFCDLG